MSAVLGRRKLPPVDVIETGMGIIFPIGGRSGSWSGSGRCRSWGLRLRGQGIAGRGLYGIRCQDHQDEGEDQKQYERHFSFA